DGKDKLVVTAKGIGKTTITVTDAGTKKSAKLTVTVKKLVESISLGVAQETDEMTGKPFVHLERKGKVNLLASASADASTKALKYVVMENKVLKDGKWIESTTVKKKKTVVAPVVTVDKKGNVTGVDEKRADVEMAKAVVRVYATDQKVINSANKAVTTGVYEDVLVYVYPKTYASKDIIQFTNLGKETNKKLGKTNTYKAQTLYTNATDTAHTLKVDAAAYKKDGSNYVKTDLQKVTYTTSNAKVATVSADGVVTAVGNGKAVISAVPAYGFATPKATVQVIVKTKPEVINVPADVLAVAEGKTVKLNASIAKNASYKKLTYTVEEGSEFVKLNAKKGTVKGLAEGIAKIKVSTVADEKGEYPVISRMVTVQVSTPVNAITLTDAADKALPKTITLYAYDKANFTTEAPSEYTLKATVTGKKNADDTYKIPSNKNVDFVPSKASVADVSKMSENMATVYANGKGTAAVTVVAQDGSNKKATAKVNVVQLVDEINVVNAYESWLEGTEKYLFLNVVKGQTTTIKASA
ncbi:MAG: Ig-like domain-containing protein, partial [Clostridia bacterium]|nr:Ig-like domain-containing protein [Clostridia bacterium]